jgi:hypothetical protein
VVEDADAAGHFALAVDQAQGWNRLDAEILGERPLLRASLCGEQCPHRFRFGGGMSSSCGSIATGVFSPVALFKLASAAWK